MGSLSPPPPPPPVPPENQASGFRICVSFCRRDETTGTTVSNWLDSYNPADNTLGHVGAIPGLPRNHILKGFAMVCLGGFVYVIGGRLCLNVLDAEGSVERDVAVRSDVLRCNVATGEWAPCSPLALQRFDFACTPCNGRIYVAGGQFTVSVARGTSAAEVYDPERDQWTPLPGMSALRYKCVGMAWEGRFHVVGGFAEREGCSRTVPSVVERSSAEVFDEERGEWDLVPGMWQLDVPPNQIVAVDGRLYSSGDCLNNWKGHIETYDGKLNIWSVIERSQLHDMSSLVAGPRERSLERLYLTMAPVGGHLYFLVGYREAGDELRSMTVAHAFDTEPGAAEAWASFEPLMADGNKELCSHCCVVQLS